MGYFVVLDFAVGVLYAVYSAWRLSKMDILDTIRAV
jgi:ABC-type antimicrobial peptide transport system permease subunit